MKFGMLVAERIDLDDEVELEPLDLAHLDQPIEDRLPVLVAGEIVVGDEEAMHALAQLTPDDLLDVVGRAPPRLAPLHIDDGAERALVGTAAAGIEAREVIGRRCDAALPA